MGAGNNSLDPRRNKNNIFLITVIILIIMIALSVYAIFYLDYSGKTYQEQIVITDDYLEEKLYN